MTKAGLVSDLHQDKGSIWRGTKERKETSTTQSCKRSPCSFTQLPLENRYEALGVVDEGCEEV